MKIEIDKLHIVHYPDPRLRQKCARVTEFNGDLQALADRMVELMRSQKGVGLAAPQVGLPIRLFVMNATGEDEDTHVLINPEISDRYGAAEAEEGCLSLPGVYADIRRAAGCRLQAQDVHGNVVTYEGEDLVARVWQHETDHLDGVLIIDRMGPADKMAVRKTLQSLEENYSGPMPPGTARR